ncbi:hypothetical protein [Hydrogenophaga sp.]|uniref:hypothetical protein n=1 Tax=Hydrogenophaga sp. TaxID=1904254 RepID=UPI0025C335D5|nr:hypothetical protein [Hydrogenophaga sp.]
MNNPKELKARFPYQFEGEAISMSYSRGWFHLFSRLCADIDETLGKDKRGFQWVQVKEKFGAARVYFRLAEGVRDQEPDLAQRLTEKKFAAEAASATTCAACGRPGWIDQRSGWMLALCEKHHQARLDDTLGSIWFEEDEL